LIDVDFEYVPGKLLAGFDKDADFLEIRCEVASKLAGEIEYNIRGDAVEC